MEVYVHLWVILGHLLEVGVWHHFEQEAQNTVAELRESFSTRNLTRQSMDDMHL